MTAGMENLELVRIMTKITEKILDNLQRSERRTQELALKNMARHQHKGRVETKRTPHGHPLPQGQRVVGGMSLKSVAQAVGGWLGLGRGRPPLSSTTTKPRDTTIALTERVGCTDAHTPSRRSGVDTRNDEQDRYGSVGREGGPRGHPANPKS